MNSISTTLDGFQSSAASRPGLTARHVMAVIGLWLLGTLIATFFSALQIDSAVVNGEYIPRSNDSFYHARRILDAVLGDGTLAQFDPRLNPPAGTVIPWPWGYDYMMVRLTELALWFRPQLDPMAFLAYVPVAWIGLNAALFLGAAGAAGLSLPMRALALLGFSLSPLTQLLHSVAMIDHHFVELSFVLAVTWLGIAWMGRPDSFARAIGLGVLLGAAPAFHIGLFLLQLIPLGAILAGSLRGNTPPRVTLVAFGAALVITTQLALLPSATYRDGVFDYTLLSWFHFYVACCTATMILLAAYHRNSKRRLIGVAVVALILAIPLMADLMRGTAFVTGNVSILPDIGEAQSPFRFDGGETVASSDGITYYSWLLLAAPLLLVWFARRLLIETALPHVYFSIAAILGLALLMLQFRFHYYGFFALIAGSLLVIESLRRHHAWHRGVVFVATFGLFALAYQPPLRDRLFTIYAASSDPDYQYSLPIHLKLAEVCAEDPGLVLANHDDGNAILFHSDCSVIANNFILGPEDDAKFAEIARLMRSPTDEILNSEIGVKYLFVRANDFGRRFDGVLAFDSSNEIANRLILSEELPAGYELLEAVNARTSPEAMPEPYARLYKLTPVEETG